ncbi:hypothetical protein [Nodosilinea sp. LEGE 06152]|uniref:hypothetical protein n=1 Tax=Nodosilinea sp. LEGE 06152 TaxID=2777966 RepID=UPI00187E5F1C|nr:hypothetical protein [Nodosilinea sp. LEGE 06152]
MNSDNDINRTGRGANRNLNAKPVPPERQPVEQAGQPADTGNTGIGPAGASVMGTAIGGIAGGPVGAAVGAAVGAVAGGLANEGMTTGHADPIAEEKYWRDNYRHQPYARSGYGYDDYSPAYRTGYEGYSRYSSQGLNFGQAEPHLRRDYDRHNRSGRLDWNQAKQAIHDAWYRLQSAVADNVADNSVGRPR